jgi:hypothetical protein
MRQVLFLTLFIIPFLSNGQTRIITGKVIDENLESLPEVRVQNHDTVLLATTDINGNFKIELPYETDQRLLSWIGMEWTPIKIPASCNTLEIIMMGDWRYYYRSHKKVDRLRKQRFNKLPQLYSEAVAKGIFVNNSPCFIRKFIPYKPSLDEIQAQFKVKRKEIKAFFKRLEVGDTIRIPYSGSYRSDGTDRTTLYEFSSVTEGNRFDCIIEGIIIDKNGRNRGYNIVYRVTNTSLCKYDSIIYNRKNMVVGEVFEHNMRYSKVLKN